MSGVRKIQFIDVLCKYISVGEKNKRKQRMYLYSSLFGVKVGTRDTQQHGEQEEKINAFDLLVEHANKK